MSKPRGPRADLAPGPPRAAPAAARDRAHGAQHWPLLPESPVAEDVLAGSEPLSFRRHGVRDQEMRRLRRGLYVIEGELDLHGLDRAAARDALWDFLARQHDRGRRCVRIVHGKGNRSGARGPILKIAVDGWLKRHPQVLAFTSARGIDGGTGALYVLLRA